MTFHAQLPPLPSQLTAHDGRPVLWTVVSLLLVLVLFIWLECSLVGCLALISPTSLQLQERGQSDQNKTSDSTNYHTSYGASR